MKLALLDKDKDSSFLLCELASAAGHHCDCFTSSRIMLEFLQRERCDLLIIDGLITGAGEVLRWARQHLSPRLPVLLLAASVHQEEIINGLDAGASDYLVRPLRRDECGLRIRVALRRAWPESYVSSQLRVGDYLFEMETGRVLLKNRPVDLTQKEFELALLLFRNLNRPLSRAYILENVWSRDMEVSSRTIDTHISRVRSKLHLRPENGFRLAPVYSFGYQLEQLPS